MPNSPVFEVAVGLVFFYCTLSLLVSAIQERISAMSSLRARGLEFWIVKMLGTDDAKRFYAHPLIVALGGAKASYISSQTFTTALLDIFGATPEAVGPAPPANADPLQQRVLATAARRPLASIPNDSIRAVLLSHFDHAQGDLTVARANVENWFDDAMERLSGAYKRRVHWYVIGVATVLTLIINADTLRVARSLYQDPVVREAFAERAREMGAQPASPSTGDVSALVSGLPLPLGWPGDVPDASGLAWFVVVKVVGVLLTVAAISLGAPFWFDLLNRIVNIRAAGAQPASSATSAQGAAGAKG